MRILAIRGENIASLAAPFELRLADEPIASSRIFAIVGPTGAGKSSLLDTLCLALFHRTPRLGERLGGTDIGLAGESERLKSYDVRGLLHRSAGKCYAECDFEGSDGGRYRARWSVKRARGKLGGTLQAPRTTLQHLESGVAIGRTKTEVADEIVARLGLNFEQFRRSVLLAQGDFAAFLRARGDERASLLERMTATPIYARLSVAAHEKAKNERAALGLQRTLMEAAAPLDEAERKELEKQSAAAAQHAQRLAEQIQLLQAEIQVLVTDAELERDIEEAAELVREKRREQAASESRRAALDVAVRAKTFRDALSTLDDAAKRAQDARNEAEAARKQVDAAALNAQSLRVEGEELAAKQHRFAEQAPEFERSVAAAVELDRTLERCGHTLSAAEADLEKTLGATAALRREMEGLAKAEAELEAGEREYAKWLDARPYRRDRHDGAQRALDALSHETKCVNKLRKLEADSSSAQVERKQAQEALGEAQKRATEALASREEARLALAACPTLDDGATLQSVRGALATISGPAAELRAQREQVSRVAVENAEARSAEGEAHDQLELAKKHAKESIAKERKQDEAFRRSEERLRQAQAAESAAALRITLEDGNPCPVCGSTDHPGNDEEGPMADLVIGLHADLKRELDLQQTARQIAEQARMDAARAQDRFDAARRRSATSSGALTSAKDRHETCKSEMLATWTRAVESLGSIDSPIAAQVRAWNIRDEDQTAALDAAIVECDRLLAAHFAAQADLQRRTAELQAANEAREQAERAVDRDTHTASAIERRCSELQSAIEAALEEATRAAEHRRSLCGDAGDATKVQEARADAERDKDSADQRYTAHDGRIAELQANRTRMGERAARVKELEVACDAQRTKVADAKTSLTAHQAKRAALLEGKSVGDARKARTLEEVALRGQRESHVARLATAEGVLRSAEAVAITQRQAAERESARHDALEQDFMARAGDAGLDLQTIRAQLETPIDIEAERRALDELKRAVMVVAMRMDARREDRRALRQKNASLFGLGPDLQGGLFEAPSPAGEVENLANKQRRALALEEQRDVAQERVARARADIGKDDESRVEMVRLMKEFEARRDEVAVWNELAELIGSADGRRFRVFAQSVTLDILLGRANSQLKRLFPRYQLERAPGSDLGLQVVDLDMGGVIRSVNTLSGGETFVVSLALALALAGLSARTTPLRTLFIDEGFGALDAASLEAVLDVLDTIQAEGKQIGIISHVAEIAERFRVRVHVTRETEGRSTVTIHPPTAKHDDAVAE